MSMISRRTALLGGIAMPFLAGAVQAAGEPIMVGTLTPQTGSGGSYGPSMVKVARAVVEAVNNAGGLLGRPVKLVSEDDETNPDAGVRAARKLIDVDKVIAICGTWASAVTTAVAPLCWQSHVMLFTVSGADSITKLPHHGYIVRTQPNTHLQSARAAQFLLTHGSKRVFGLSAQTPFATDSYKRLADVLKAGGAEAIGDVIYDASKTGFRSEVDQALNAKPDTLFLNGYAPDVTILLREIYQAGFDGTRFTFGYAANNKTLSALPTSVTNGLISFAPSPDPDSPAYARVRQILGTQDPDPYACQIYDHVSLVALAIAKAGAATASSIHDSVRLISQGDGEKVHSVVEGLKLLAAGKQINYEGASGPCDFTPEGDIISCKFRFDEAKDGKNKLLMIS